jgi:hypothetical protein
MSESIARKTIKYQSYKKDWAKRDNPASASFEKEILKNKNLNPAGKLQVKTSYAPFGSMTIHEAKALPDPAASSRGANVRANKERGTQSSSQRKVIK